MYKLQRYAVFLYDKFHRKRCCARGAGIPSLELLMRIFWGVNDPIRPQKTAIHGVIKLPERCDEAIPGETG